MFSRFATLLSIAALAAVVTAAPSALEARGMCSSGNTYCCDQKFDSTTKFTGKKDDSIVGAIVSAIAEGGIECTPVNVLAIDGQQCNTQTACCNDEKDNGAVNMSCTPVNANL